MILHPNASAIRIFGLHQVAATLIPKSVSSERRTLRETIEIIVNVDNNTIFLQDRYHSRIDMKLKCSILYIA